MVEREPENSDALLAAGLLYLQEKQYQPAAEMLRRYLELEPGADQARLYLARIAREEQRYQAALEWLSGVYGERYYLEAQLTISRIMADQGRLDEALTHLAEIMPRSVAGAGADLPGRGAIAARCGSNRSGVGALECSAG